ncbi:hypothetical protein KIN20_017679 [Parelaphostrongylus tenuis]|uniref:Uncharacterized protein n=1 Tax=Parelaphostrongylus tenuis TaxID=148309 RepID=A0AAD5N3D3_PARTN|nr:hypothetical protein KIN20_017679 [Parelaphostrongylus tenuis]
MCLVQHLEEDGWRLGYDVELNGFGFVEVTQGSDSEDESTECGVDDVELTQHPGYRSLSQLEESSADYVPSSDGPDESVTGNEVLSEVNGLDAKDVHTEEADNFSGEIREACFFLEPITPSTCETIADDLVIPHQPIDIALDDEKTEFVLLCLRSRFPHHHNGLL